MMEPHCSTTCHWGTVGGGREEGGKGERRERRKGEREEGKEGERERKKGWRGARKDKKVREKVGG